MKGMKILIAINDYLNKSNGMCISTQRFVERFRAAGHEVRVLSNRRYGEVDYSLDVVRVPLFAGIIEKEGYTFARADLATIRRAVEWADLVHVEDPFLVCHTAASMARRAGKPVTGTFHLYPENMTYAVHLGGASLVNRGFMRAFVQGVYDLCSYVQCPTEEVRKRLVEAGAKAQLEVISNGIPRRFIEAGMRRIAAPEAGAPETGTPESGAPEAGAPKAGATEPGAEPLRVLCVGRYAQEKNQTLLLEALARSRHAAGMRVVLAGKGPLEDALRARAAELGLSVEFGFHGQGELLDLMCASDLYVHCADVEVEGMSCMEAFACGCVPLISDAPLSSTGDFALGDRCLFRAGDARDLAERLDWFFENRDELSALSRRYVERARELDVSRCAEAVLDMMSRARDEAAGEPQDVRRRPGVRLKRPSFRLPTPKLPTVEMPAPKLPAIGLPTIEIPTPKRPSFGLPTIELSSLDAPSPVSSAGGARSAGHGPSRCGLGRERGR